MGCNINVDKLRYTLIPIFTAVLLFSGCNNFQHMLVSFCPQCCLHTGGLFIFSNEALLQFLSLFLIFTND